MKTINRSTHRTPAGTFALIPIAAAVLLSGCGGQGTESKRGDADAQVAVVLPSENATVALPEAPVAQGDSRMDTQPAIQGESLPPDLSVTVSDTLVSPGESVEITAEGTSDVGEIVLWDGIHDRQALTYDSMAKVWRTNYRVPLRPSSERFGLSVTAKNEANRWRRVWVFLSVQREEPTVQPDSTID